MLIVIAIIGALSAVMSVSITRSNARARAKAVAIVTNVSTCRSAAALYYMEIFGSNDVKFEKQKVTAFLPTDGDSEYVPSWSDFRTGNINYSATGDIPSEWTVTVDFTNDSDHDDIASVLAGIKGYSAVKGKTSFKVTLLSGKVEGVATSGGGGETTTP